MATNIESVAKLYDIIDVNEDNRLETHPMERELTRRALRHYLGAATRHVADIGGGPGRIAFPLADDGYAVDLVDLSPAMVRLAQKEQDARRAAPGGKPLLQSITVGNALVKSSHLPEGSYDAVLLLGPLYHLINEDERIKAVENALLLAKPTGLIFVAFVSIAAHLRDIAIRDPKKLVNEREFYSEYLQHGGYVKYKADMGLDAQGFHTSAADVKAFFARHFAGQLDLVDLRSTEGILGGGLDAKLEEAGPDVVQAWADLMWDEYSQKDEFLGCADHLLAVARKK